MVRTTTLAITGIVLILIYLTSCKTRSSSSLKEDLELISKADNQDVVDAIKVGIEALLRINKKNGSQATEFMKSIGADPGNLTILKVSENVSSRDREIYGLEKLRQHKGTKDYSFAWRDSMQRSHELVFEVTRVKNTELTIKMKSLGIRLRQETRAFLKPPEALQVLTEDPDELIIHIDTTEEKRLISAYFQNAKIFASGKWNKIIPKFDQNVRKFNIKCPMIGGDEHYINQLWLEKDGSARKIGFETDTFGLNNFEVNYKDEDLKDDSVKVDISKWESYELKSATALTIMNTYFLKKTEKSKSFKIIKKCAIAID